MEAQPWLCPPLKRRGGHMSGSRNQASENAIHSSSRRLCSLFFVVFPIASRSYPFATVRLAYDRPDAFPSGVGIGMPAEVGKLESIAQSWRFESPVNATFP